MATGGSAQMRGFAIGVGFKADIGAPPLTLLSFMSTRPSSIEILPWEFGRAVMRHLGPPLDA